MIARQTAIQLIALYFLCCVSAAVAWLTHVQSPEGILFGAVLRVPFVVACCLLAIRLTVKNGMSDELQNFLRACLVSAACLLLAEDLFRMFYIPLTGAGPDGYNHAVVAMGGVVFITIGNLLPKLPYQAWRSWLEIGPVFSYRLNRLCGWLMVVVGLGMLVAGLAVRDMPGDRMRIIVRVAVALVLITYTLLHVRYVRIRRQNGGD